MPSEEIKKPTKSKSPLVSIITPLYNAAPFITENIKCVRDQSYTNWQHIIIDDASSDDSAVLVQQLAIEDQRIVLEVLDKNQGAAYCRNLATELAKGDYIAFLDADDLWRPNKLQRQISEMMEAEAYVSFTSYLHIDETGSPLNKRIVAMKSLTYTKQLRNNYIGNLTGMYNAKRLGKIMSPNIRKRQDWAVWLEAINRSNKPALGIQEDLAFYRIRKGSMSSNKFKLIGYNYQFYRAHLGFGRIKSVLALIRFFVEYFFVRPRFIEKL